MEQNLKISVIIMAYNRQDFLSESLMSCLNQTLAPEMYEIIVLKNFDFTPIVENIRGVNVRFIRYEDEKVGKMMLKGVEAAKYKIISFLDDDDIFLPNKLETIIRCFGENNNLIFVRNNIKIFTTDFGNTKIEMNKMKHSKHFILDELNRKKIYKAINMGGYLNTSSMSILREVILNQRHILEEQETAPDITLFYMALSEQNKNLMFIDEPLTLYRFHDSVSHTFDIKSPYYLPKLREITLKNINSLRTILYFTKESTIRNVLILSISAWEVQLSILSDYHINFSTFINSIKFSIQRRKIIILLTTLISSLNNKYTNRYFKKIFLVVDKYRMENTKFL